jgi:hypothetical protein
MPVSVVATSLVLPTEVSINRYAFVAIFRLPFLAHWVIPEHRQFYGPPICVSIAL